jgi:hypothetical protein
VSAPTLPVKAKGDKNLDNQAKTNSLFVVRVTLNLRITLDQGHKPLKLNARNDPFVIDARSNLDLSPHQHVGIFSIDCRIIHTNS